MTTKQSFKSSRSFIIILHSPSNAATELQMCYLWHHSLLVNHGNILETLDMSFIFVQYPHSMRCDYGKYGIKITMISTSFKIVISQLILNRIETDPNNSRAYSLTGNCYLCKKLLSLVLSSSSLSSSISLLL